MIHSISMHLQRSCCDLSRSFPLSSPLLALSLVSSPLPLLSPMPFFVGTWCHLNDNESADLIICSSVCLSIHSFISQPLCLSTSLSMYLPISLSLSLSFSFDLYSLSLSLASHLIFFCASEYLSVSLLASPTAFQSTDLFVCLLVNLTL